jgi:hypothetical protein
MSDAEDLVARKRAARIENDRAVLRVLAAAGETGVRPGRDLAELAGRAERTANEALRRLIEAGLAKRDGRRRAWATTAGRTELGAEQLDTLAPAAALEPALACLPAEALRAFARLQLEAVPARWHLHRVYNDGWPGFIACGLGKMGKTAVAKLVCRVYGLEKLQAIKKAFRQTPGSLVGRRDRDSSSATGWRLERSPLLELPYLCVDEWEKAPREVQAAAGGLLFGETADELERERFEIRPTVYTTLNTGPDGLRALHSAHVRRSVVLDTTPLRQLLVDIDREMWRLFDSGEIAIRRVSLSRLRPPAIALPAELRELLRSELRAGLTDEGWDLSDPEHIGRIVLGVA